jgi:hypothetical protein
MKNVMVRIKNFVALLFAVAGFIACSVAEAQKIEITLGPNEIGENTLWPVTITVYNGQLKSFDRFPDIPGFKKSDESFHKGVSGLNGKYVAVEARTMYYFPATKGEIIVPSFSMKVNNTTVNVKGKKVTVRKISPHRTPPSAFPRDPNDFFSDEEPDYVDVPDDAFLAVTTDKKEVYVGEGIHTLLAFYRSESNRASLNFPNDISRQLVDILKGLKPTNCWEESFDIESIEGERMLINGKYYQRFKLYEAMLYPFNAESIKFPEVGLKMLKYKVASRPSYYHPNRQEGYKTFTSEAVTVKVKDLPPHPLKNSVAVGDFKLADQISKTDIATGESTAYEFNVYGEGNIASLPNPITSSGNEFEIYDPNIRQEISRAGNRIGGVKSFRYFMIPKEPGKYKLADYFRWIYFSPTTKKYDTLASSIVVNISGESKKNEAIDSHDPGDFYTAASSVDNTLKVIENNRWQKWTFQGFIVLMVGASAFLLFKKP